MNSVAKLKNSKGMEKKLGRDATVTQWCACRDLQKGLKCAFNVVLKLWKSWHAAQTTKALCK